MSSRVEWTASARRDIRRLDSPVARRVVVSVVEFAESGRGDVIKLQGTEMEWRLRVGDWRVRFTFTDQGHTIMILRVLHRSQAYR